MTNIQETIIKSEGIAHLLQDRKLVVPPYQRSYSWEKHNVEQFFLDITDAFLEGHHEYFLGSIVLIKSDNGKLEIVDGQQRLATTALFIAAIKNYFIKNGEKIRADAVVSKYLYSIDELSMDMEQHLELNVQDNGFFQELCEKPWPVTPVSRKSVKNLFSASELAEQKVEDIAKNTKDPVNTLARLVKYLKDNVKAIAVIVPDEANAFTIFETLNDRGLALSIADLLKNYLFGKSEKRIEEAKSQWALLSGILETIGDDSLLPTFIRHFWSSHYGPTTEKELFNKIKTRINSSKDAIDFIDKLVKHSKDYVALLNPEHEKWQKLSPDVQQSIKIINDMRLEQPRPLLLAIVGYFSDRELSKALKKTVDWTVRLQVAGNTRTGQFAKTLSDISIKVVEGEIVNTKQLTIEIQKILPSNEDFSTAFENLGATRYIARYYLIEFEKKQRELSGEKIELVPSYSTDEVNLEHILPITPGKEWPDTDTEVSRAYYNRLGNLTIINSKENSKLGNQSFSKKKIVYKSSAFQLTKSICKYTDWDIDSIKDRQKDMAKLAPKIWPII